MPRSTTWDDCGTIDIPDTLLDGCEAVWLPWLHRHRIAWNRCVGVVASFHDATFLRFGDLAKRHPHSLFVESERQITGRWLGSPAQVVCSSRVTRDELVGSFGVAVGRLEVIRVAGDDSQLEVGDTPKPSWPWLARPYLLCPANTALHKNHEVLFKGVATWGAGPPSSGRTDSGSARRAGSCARRA